MVSKRRHRVKKSFQRRWITFLRILRHGSENFIRNAWLSLAAILIMTITLLIIFLAVASNDVLHKTVDSIRDGVDMSIYVKNNITDADARKIQQELQKLDSVVSVKLVEAKQAKKDIEQKYVGDDEILHALSIAKNKLPSTYQIKVKDINNPGELEHFVQTNETVKKWLDEKQPPSFSSSSRTVIDNIARYADFAEKIGILVAVIFVAVSILVVFNTIRMAIFNRKDEIYMMRLIGAEPGFVRSPFIVEAVLNGLISAVIATSLGIVIMNLVKDGLTNYGIIIAVTLRFVSTYWYVVYGVMIGFGFVIGVFSSILATAKYLKS